MEALIGNPTNGETDQEITLILNQYGLDDIKGPNGDALRRLKDGTSKLRRQLVEKEDYSSKIPQLKYEPQEQVQQPTQGSYGSDTRPGDQTCKRNETKRKP